MADVAANAPAWDGVSQRHGAGAVCTKLLFSNRAWTILDILVNSAALRTLVIYAVVLPLAVLIGWMATDLANWNRTSFGVMAAVLFVLLIPVFLRWHYPILVFAWNTAITVFFLPGSPSLWMLMAGLNFGLAILRRVMQKQPAFLSAPPVTVSLIALALVVVATAKLTGGMGLQVAGSSTFGGRGYYYILAAIVGYFALASVPISPDKYRRYVNMFFLSSLVTAVSNLIYFAGPSLYFLFLIFPVGFAVVQAGTEQGGSLGRVAGFMATAVAIVHWQLALHGVRGVLAKWRRVLLVFAAIAAGSLGGYRSILVMLGVVCIVLFVLEGLWKTRYLPIGIFILTLGIAGLIPLASKLPAPAQRTISFLPFVEVDPHVRRDAASSLEWRYVIWRAVVPDLPKYFWLGKGYAINPTEMYLAEEAVKRGRSVYSQTTKITGDYHNGPLSVYVPFGMPGTLAFLSFLVVGTMSLFRNYRYGVAELKTANRFFLALFISKVIFFLFFFGALSSDLFQFTGILGMSVALNRGVCRKPHAALQPLRYAGALGQGTASAGTA